MNATCSAIRGRRLALCLAASLGLLACSRPAEPAPVLLVSLDGFRADYLDRGRTPNLARLAREGVHARWMIPSYPALTFPNHYTLVTGLRPDRHGIVHNTMADPALGKFKLTERRAVADGRWWGGVPIWVTAQRAGLPTATLFWPGSEAAIDGVRPTRWLPYDEHLPAQARVDTVLGWLAEPVATRPRLATLYLEALDATAHKTGPDSHDLDRQLAQVDAQIGRLLQGLAQRGLRDRVNVVVVSDHGMAPVTRERSLAIEDLVDAADASVVTTGEILGFVPVPGREAQARARLLGRHRGYECWNKSELPARWHYGTHPRIPPIVCQTDEGWVAVPRKRIEKHAPGTTRGAHGFDPHSPSMRALFIAAGPAFRDGVELPPFENVDVYPLLARLLGVTPAAHDGNPRTFEAALEHP